MLLLYFEKGFEYIHYINLANSGLGMYFAFLNFCKKILDSSLGKTQKNTIQTQNSGEYRVCLQPATYRYIFPKSF